MRESSDSDEQVIHATVRWLERAVIGLGLCPFAKAVHVKRQIRYVVTAADTEAALLAALDDELQTLAAAAASTIDTTLLIHPQVLQDFDDYNQFLDAADAAIEAQRLDGILQIASFHPHYRFADAGPDDIENFSNRSPYPMLHLLREESVTRAVAAFPDAAGIYDNNLRVLRALGHEGWRALWLDPDEA